MKCNNYSSVLSANLIGKKIIIAGCNSYIGTELTNQLELNNIAYIGIDKTPTNKNNCLNFNLSNKRQVIDVISAEKPDYFFHMATHSALAYKNDFLNAFHEDNSALYNIISDLKKTDNAQLIYFSSSYVYSGLDVDNTVDEKTILNPSHNFGLAKLFFEQMILREYSNSIIFRLSSVFGQGNYLHPNAIEVMAKDAIESKLLTIWGKGNRKMQYVFLEDVVKYILKTTDLSPGIYNLCGNDYATVKETAIHISKYFVAEIKMLTDKVEGETLPYMDNKKIIKAINHNLFSDHVKSLSKYLATISN